MKARNKFASTAWLVAVLASQGALAQGFGISPRGTNTGQDTTAPGSKGDQERRAGAALGSSDGLRGESRMKSHHKGTSADRSASAPGGSSENSQ